MRPRLHAVLALALAVALLAAIAPSFGSAKHLRGAGVPQLWTSPADDPGDILSAVAPEPFTVVALVFGLALVVISCTTANGAAGEARRVRGPPRR